MTTPTPAPTFPRAERDALRELHAKATPGEIKLPECDWLESVICKGTGIACNGGCKHTANAEFVAAAHNALPRLLDALCAAEAENKRLRAGLAELAAQAREDLADLHECDACEGMRSDQDDLRNPAGDDRPCPQCGGIGRYDERAPLARAVLRLADESETTRQPEAAP